jgi:PAS domain S-box-containing protein
MIDPNSGSAPDAFPSSGDFDLLSQNARLNEMLANVPGVVWEQTFDGSIRYTSNYVEVMLGYSAEEYLARFTSVLELVHVDDRETFERTSAEQIAGKHGPTHCFRLVRKDGCVIWCESHVSVIRNEQGEPIGMRGVSMDVTERMASEEALRQSEARFHLFADAAPVMIWTTNATGAADFQNREVAAFTGDPDLSGEKWQTRVHPDDLDRVADAMQTAHARGVWTPYEMRVRRYDNDYRDLYVTAVARFGADGVFAGFLGTSVDLTDHRRLLRRLEEDKRMESLGHLAARIAHEINNVLMSIQPFSEVLRRSPAPDVLDRAAVRIANAVQRGGRITHQILRYAHTGEPSPLPLDVKTWIAANADELQTLLGHGVELRLDVPRNLRIAADPHQLQQVFSNLAANATDAMHGIGVFRITARAEPAWTGLTPRDEGFVHFIIEDDGPGIPPEIAANVFEPLFTTKSHGTGLGLAIVHDVIRKHGGVVFVDLCGDVASDRRGARLHIVLPATRVAASDVQEQSDAWPEHVRRVLLVEDEDAVAEALALMVEMLGARTAVVNRGAEAIDAIEIFTPDLVVLDVGLPDISGTEVFVHIRAAHPNLPVLFATGHAGELEARLAKLTGPVGYILKPFDFSAFIGAVRLLV